VQVAKQTSHGQCCRDNPILFLFLSPNQQSINNHHIVTSIHLQYKNNAVREYLYNIIKIRQKYLGGKIFHLINHIF
jgi:hypothetical protein